MAGLDHLFRQEGEEDAEVRERHLVIRETHNARVALQDAVTLADNKMVCFHPVNMGHGKCARTGSVVNPVTGQRFVTAFIKQCREDEPQAHPLLAQVLSIVGRDHLPKEDQLKLRLLNSSVRDFADVYFPHVPKTYRQTSIQILTDLIPKIAQLRREHPGLSIKYLVKSIEHGRARKIRQFNGLKRCSSALTAEPFNSKLTVQIGERPLFNFPNIANFNPEILDVTLLEYHHDHFLQYARFFTENLSVLIMRFTPGVTSDRFRTLSEYLFYLRPLCPNLWKIKIYGVGNISHNATFICMENWFPRLFKLIFYRESGERHHRRRCLTTFYSALALSKSLRGIFVEDGVVLYKCAHDAFEICQDL